MLLVREATKGSSLRGVSVWCIVFPPQKNVQDARMDVLNIMPYS